MGIAYILFMEPILLSLDKRSIELERMIDSM